jgi:hypothetical protein
LQSFLVGQGSVEPWLVVTEGGTRQTGGAEHRFEDVEYSHVLLMAELVMMTKATRTPDYGLGRNLLRVYQMMKVRFWYEMLDRLTAFKL